MEDNPSIPFRTICLSNQYFYNGLPPLLEPVTSVSQPIGHKENIAHVDFYMVANAKKQRQILTYEMLTDLLNSSLMWTKSIIDVEST